MEIKEECALYLEDYYKGLFFGNVNKKYRAMTKAEANKRLSRLNEAGLEKIVKANELSDIHAMASKVCSYLMHRENHLKPGPMTDEWTADYEGMQAFCGALARKDLEYVSFLTLEELEQVMKMQGVRRYLLTNSLERAYQLFYVPKTIKRGIREAIQQKPEDEYPGAREMKRKFILHIGPTNSGKTHDAWSA